MIEDEKSNHETKFYNEPQKTKSSENPPVYDEPPIDSTAGNLGAPVMVQPPAGYITVQPVVQPVITAVNSYTSMCECDDIWCSFCWLSSFEIGCIGFLTNAKLYNSSGLRSGYILVVILMTLASCLLFTWLILPWLLPLLWTFYGLLFVCSIITIVLQQ